MGLTALCFWALGQLPAADEALLHPALRGALVAANLMALVRFASGSVRTTGGPGENGGPGEGRDGKRCAIVLIAGHANSIAHPSTATPTPAPTPPPPGRVVRIASAALRFSERAELVLLALQVGLGGAMGGRSFQPRRKGWNMRSRWVRVQGGEEESKVQGGGGQNWK